MKIIKLKKDKSNVTDISLELPITIHLHGERTFDDCAKVAQEFCVNNTSIIFEHLEYLTTEAENGGCETTHYFEVVAMLSALGLSLSKTMEGIEMQRQNRSPQNTKPLDLSQLNGSKWNGAN